MQDLPDFLQNLNPSQYEAVIHQEGPLLVLAGAGTGKTKVLTSRIANLISNDLALPSQILAVTFTNKAAREMLLRVNAIISCPGLNIGTFHSIAVKILRLHIDRLSLGFDSNFSIIDADDQTKLIKEIAIRQNIDIKLFVPKLIKVIISRWKDLSLLPEKLSPSDTILPIQKIAANIYFEYQQQLMRNNSLDFGDLLMYNNELLIKHNDLLEHYQNQYKYIMIDEYQDTNAVQYIWARMLASKSKNICCVGDDDQSIYGWRGAEVGNILRFEKDFPNAKVIKLEQNYRSTSEILSAASSIIKNNKTRHHKDLWTDKKIGEKIKIISCWNDREEARFVGCEIEKAIRENRFQGRNIAILVRAGFQTRAFEEIFISNALPYKIIGGLRFYERAEIRDILAYIKIIFNHQDNLALERIINVPKRAIGNITLKLIKDYSTTHQISLLHAIKQLIERKELKTKSLDTLENFLKQIDSWSDNYKNQTPLEATKIMLEESGYLNALKSENTDESKGRIENINELLKAINEFNHIEEFIEHASIVMDNESLEEDYGGHISIMTLHASKGLEFELVFLPGWEEGLFPHQKSLNEEGNKGIEEERRIAYVGITRAKKDLYISFAASRWMFNEMTPTQPSRFLAEIPREVCYQQISNRSLNYLGSKHSFNMQPHANAHANIAATLKGDISESPISSGKRVRHEKFGYGVVIQVKDDNLEIIFENGGGIKNIKKSYILPA